MDLVNHAYKLLKGDDEMIADARAGAHVGNTVIGSVMQATLKQPRWATERAVRDALARIEAEASHLT